MRGLFIDDDEYRFELALMLGKVPSGTSLVTSYTDALEALSTNPIDLLFLDGNLRDSRGNGLDVARWMWPVG